MSAAKVKRLSFVHTSPERQQKRMSIACDTCRKRKIRCDVGQNDGPCTACRQGRFSCNIPHDKRRRTAERTARARASARNSTWQDAGTTDTFVDQYHTVDHPATSSLQPSLSDITSNLDSLTPWSRQYLSANGCLESPPFEALQALVKAYFLHIHPSLLILDEKDFRLESIHEEYSNNLASTSQRHTSIFVLQAILAASCTFVPLDVLQACNLDSYASARACFCHRAGLLYESRIEHDPFTLARGALILSTCSSNDDLIKDNSFWLQTAIRFVGMGRATDDGCGRPKGAWQRLWSCCVLRDGLHSLVARRPLQSMSLDLRHRWSADGATLPIADVEDMFEGSHIYGKTVTRELVTTYIAQQDLVMELGPLLAMTYPPGGSLLPRILSHEDAGIRLYELGLCRSRLDEWYQKHERLRRTAIDRAGADGSPSMLPLLFLLRVDMQFQTARITLHSNELFIHYLWPDRSTWPQGPLQRNAARDALYNGVVSISSITSQLAKYKLDAKMDMQGPACLVSPLQILLLTLKLNRTSPHSDSLRYLIRPLNDSMNLYRIKWDGLDRVFDRIKLLVPATQYNLDDDPGMLTPSAPLAEEEHQVLARAMWSESMEAHLPLYMALIAALNACISKGLQANFLDLPEQLSKGIEL